MANIRTEDEYKQALARINELAGVKYSSPEGAELVDLVNLVKAYEEKNFPIQFADDEASVIIAEIDLLLQSIELIDNIKRHILSLYRKERERGVSMDTIARRIGRTSQELREMLNPNGNLTLDTISDLFAAVGHEIEFNSRKRCHAE